ncbi:class I SAM-dependent methyltransferase [Cellulomonas pakistanensis]|uniref:SAM-dependent methyltransferase n=1 Tax=Cellulomonas pakistanensis TaxID=992287 RepID=A0A919U8A5_9CELL|nr:methyltransferase domain-containing protein [Cellulomonas pakistanensis]GIG37767.1 SAM-dependent methyltransferase [Cellulomonas pakistanensis]
MSTTTPATGLGATTRGTSAGPDSGPDPGTTAGSAVTTAGSDAGPDDAAAVSAPAADVRAAARPGDLLEPVGPSTAEVADRVFAASLGAQELAAVHAGDRLGWYRALDRHGPCTADELAALTATHPRYVREWLEHQAACGYLVVDGGAFALTPGAAAVLADPDSPDHLAPLGRMHAASVRVSDELHAAYRSGGGVPWERLGADAREAQAALNRPFFLDGLAAALGDALPGLDARLRAGGRVLDVGCGEGWSSIGLALAHEDAEVTGVDLDEASVAAARRHAAARGVEDRVRFVAADASSLGPRAGRGFDLALAFECVHDLADPVGVLGALRALVAADGWVVVADERVAEEFAAPAGPLERWYYGFSLGVCLPDGMSHRPSAGTGTVMRPATLAGYARAAGYAAVEVLPVEHDLFRFYRLRV